MLQLAVVVVTIPLSYSVKGYDFTDLLYVCNDNRTSDLSALQGCKQCCLSLIVADSIKVM